MSTAATEMQGLREENRTLYGVIKLVSSSMELAPMLQGVVDLASEATDCHACFIYLLEDEQLTIRAASEVYATAVGRVQFSLHEGLTGWVARHRTPEFIREHAMEDPRMKYVPLLEEERFQSMVAVPILARSGDTLGVIVLHTRAPREFTEDTVKLLVHIASLVSGAIENAQLYEHARRRVEGLTSLAGLGREVASATDPGQLATIVTRGARRLLDAEFCQLFRLDAEGDLQLLQSDPATLPPPPNASTVGLLIDALDGRRVGASGTPLWPDVAVADLLVTPLTAGEERVGLICAGSCTAFSHEDTELARAVAHLGAVALKRVELIGELTSANIVKDLFEALATGATGFAVSKASEVRCDLTGRFLMICAEPAGDGDAASVEWRRAADALGRGLAAQHPHAAIEAGPGPVRAAVPLPAGAPVRPEELLRSCQELGRETGAAIGLSQLHEAAAETARAYREARDATTIGRALLRDGGAISYTQLGAYRYLVHIPADEAPTDRMRTVVDTLIAYDQRRRAALLDTLERYLAERRSVIESARALFIHPNTLRQRLARIEELTGVELDSCDLLSLELAIKLARLHGRPAVPTVNGAAASGSKVPPGAP